MPAAPLKWRRASLKAATPALFARNRSKPASSRLAPVSRRADASDEGLAVEISRVEFSGPSKLALASVLSAHLDCHPNEVRLGCDVFGKPKLLHPRTERPLEFSLSHCKGRYLIAVSFAGQVGADIERLRSVGHLDRIASLYFTAPEAEMISAWRQHREKMDAFFACWTLKEAYTKAIGTGLLTPFDTFSFPCLSPTGNVATCAAIQGRQWTYLTFQPWPGYAAAVVVAGARSRSAFHLKDAYVANG